LKQGFARVSTGYTVGQVVGAVGFQGAQLPPPAAGDACLRELCVACMAGQAALRPAFPARPGGSHALLQCV